MGTNNKTACSGTSTSVRRWYKRACTAQHVFMSSSRQNTRTSFIRKRKRLDALLFGYEKLIYTFSPRELLYTIIKVRTMIRSKYVRYTLWIMFARRSRFLHQKCDDCNSPASLVIRSSPSRLLSVLKNEKAYERINVWRCWSHKKKSLE